jgi:uncharacterized protein (DUF1330 family)
MKMKNAVEPREAQLQQFLSLGDGPVSMVNLLKFKKRAEYPDGRDAQLSGKEAYFRYALPMTKLVLDAGGTLDFSGDVSPLLIGELEQDWDMVAIMTYPSPHTLADISQTPEFKTISEHRKAGLEGQLLIPCRMPQS